MFTELLEAQLSDIKASTVTEIFLWLLVFCLLGSLYFARKGELPRLTMYTPTLLHHWVFLAHSLVCVVCWISTRSS